VRVAVVGGEEFEKAHLRAFAGGGNERRCRRRRQQVTNPSPRMLHQLSLGREPEPCRINTYAAWPVWRDSTHPT